MATFLRLLAVVIVELCSLINPNGIGYSANNNKVYVVEGKNYCIQVLNSDLRPISILGGKGGGKGQFYRPHGVATDSTGRV